MTSSLLKQKADITKENERQIIMISWDISSEDCLWMLRLHEILYFVSNTFMKAPDSLLISVIAWYKPR